MLGVALLLVGLARAAPHGEDADDDRWPDSVDCAPEDPDVFPGAPEVCNGIDDDCDGLVDDIEELCNGIDDDCDDAIDEGCPLCADDGQVAHAWLLALFPLAWGARRRY